MIFDGVRAFCLRHGRTDAVEERREGHVKNSCLNPLRFRVFLTPLQTAPLGMGNEEKKHERPDQSDESSPHAGSGEFSAV